MNPFILNIAIIFLPGIIVTSILQFFNTLNKKYTSITFFLYSFLNGIFTYFILFYFRKKSLFLTLNTLVLNTSSKKSNDITLFITHDFDFFLSLIIACFLGILFSFIRNRGYLHSLAFHLKITYESGFDSIIEYIYKDNSNYTNSLKLSYVNVKLLDGSAIYQGKLIMQEFRIEFTEILLNDVDIFFKNNPLDENKKYHQSDIYLQLKPGTFIIEWYDSDFSPDYECTFLFTKIFLSLIFFIFSLFFLINYFIKFL